MNQQPTKRRNPFEKPISSIIKEEEEKNSPQIAVEVTPVNEKIIEEPVVEEIVPQNQPIPQQQPVYQPQQPVQYEQQPVYYQPIPQQPQQIKQQRVVKRETKNYYAPQVNDTREKFTSTMEQTLRRRIKIVCAQRGIMFAQFVEDACREKLEREGFK